MKGVETDVRADEKEGVNDYRALSVLHFGYY